LIISLDIECAELSITVRLCESKMQFLLNSDLLKIVAKEIAWVMLVTWNVIRYTLAKFKQIYGLTNFDRRELKTLPTFRWQNLHDIIHDKVCLHYKYTYILSSYNISILIIRSIYLAYVRFEDLLSINIQKLPLDTSKISISI